ncbi:MAG TPA: nucleoside hydrolase [bacterium]|nr:nucleoside hydrolase [bacterium]
MHRDPSTPRSLIIDTDTGIDDAIALLMALASPRHHVAAITAVTGNVPVDHVVRNIRIVLDAAGALPTPVFAGATRHLVGEGTHARHVHGDDGLGDAGFRPSTRPLEDEHAALALIRLARENPGLHTLVTLGPLTNIALAYALAPDLPELFARIVTMGGAVHGRGNVTPVAEFNIFADPEAAAIVFERTPELTLVPWETVLATPVPWEQWESVTSAGPLGQKFVRPMTARLVQRHRTTREGLALADPLAMAVVLEEEGATKTRAASVRVETGPGPARGLTHAAAPRNPQRGNARIVDSVDRTTFLALLGRAFAGECFL